MKRVVALRNKLSRIPRIFLLAFCSGLCLVLFAAAPAQSFIVIGMGDSIGEGVQSADANFRTQPNSYLKLLAQQIGARFPLPLIKTSPRGVIGDTTCRSRVFPYLPGANLAVSGADVDSLLRKQADATDVSEIDSETDLVLFPRTGSQIEIAEAIGPHLIVSWIGNNDVLSAVTTFDELDGSQITPLDEFQEDFEEIAQRLSAAGAKIVFANIPSVTSIAFLVDRQDLITFLGSDFGLAGGDFTTIITMLLIKLGFDDGSLLEDPNFVLDAEEAEIIQQSIEDFNLVIQDEAAELGIPVVDINTLFHEASTNPPEFFGIPVTRRFLGGLFSLDGVHPSNTCHAIAANAFIETINNYFQTNIPLFSQEELESIFLSDPFVDKDGDLVVKGRPLAGLLETLGPALGISGDFDDTLPASRKALVNPSLGKQFIEQYLSLQGRDPRLASQWTKSEAIEALKHVFGLKIFSRIRK
jgi:lysophospholipase L1-like esterase